LPDVAGTNDDRISENPSTFKRIKVDFPIVKLWSDVKDLGTVLFRLEEELELTIRLRRVDAVPPEWLPERRAGRWHKAPHRLT
jgi:hypothetical protein